MKKSIAIITLCVAAIAASAQKKADIEVSYRFEYPNYRTATKGPSNQYILLANAQESKFFSPKTEYLDSLKSTPEGEAKLNEMTRIAMGNGNYDDIPRADGVYYVVKSRDSLRYYETVGMDKLFSEEPVSDMEWEIGDSTKMVLGYECVKATTDFHGRKWKAWFATEIPIQNGPWKFSGLPGLIMEAESDDGMYLFTATGIEQTSKPIGQVYLADSYEKVSRTDLLKAKRAFCDNPVGNISAQFGGNVKVLQVDDDGNTVDNNERLFAPRDVIDFIETDY